MRRNKELSLAGKDVIAFDFGHHTSKLIHGKATKNTMTIEKAVEFPTPPRTIDRGVVVDAPLLANTIKELLRSEKIRTTLAVATIENTEIITREIVLPTAPDDQMLKILDFEAQQYLPIELNSHIVQSKQIDTIMEEGVSKTRFLTTAVPDELARSYFQLFEAASLSGVVLDIHSNSVDKLVQSGMLLGGDEHFNRSATAIIDFGYQGINVMFFESGAFRFNRLINQGTAVIDRNLMSYFNCSPREAEEIKRRAVDLSRGEFSDFAMVESADEESARANNMVRTAVEGWVTELERIFRYFVTRSAANSLDQIYIYGGTVGLAGFSAYLQESLGITVETIADVPGARSKSGSINSMTPFVNALGAMLRR
jgi:type IV pilus assembly protein PilM